METLADILASVCSVLGILLVLMMVHVACCLKIDD